MDQIKDVQDALKLALQFEKDSVIFFLGMQEATCEGRDRDVINLLLVKFIWDYFHDRGERHRQRPYQTEIRDVYREPRFPMWVGFLWKPRYSERNPVPLDQLTIEMRSLHLGVRTFYEGKDEAILGNVFIYDPLFGRMNLIVTLRIGIYHDQLHYDDIPKMINKD